MDPVSSVVFETERLYLREFVREDAPAVFEYAGNIENTGFLPFSPEPYEDVLAFIERKLADQIESPRRKYDLAICLKETDEMIGSMSLILSEDKRQAELGYLLNMRHWHKGYATEAAKGFLRFGFLGLDLHRIHARCDDRNAASYGVMERIGMRREAHFIKNEYTTVFAKKGWRSTYYYAILQKEYLMGLSDGDHSPVSGG
ncbi:MAG: GNAT family N-acetyltransferase [Clostridia bacterium]|nr:GNAT family N-acetyltransferase [Clostridia bacterium]